MIKALREMGRVVDYVIYPDEGHDFTRRTNRIDYMRRTVEFFRKYLKPAGNQQ